MIFDRHHALNARWVLPGASGAHPPTPACNQRDEDPQLRLISHLTDRAPSIVSYTLPAHRKASATTLEAKMSAGSGSIPASMLLRAPSAMARAVDSDVLATAATNNSTPAAAALATARGNRGDGVQVAQSLERLGYATATASYTAALSPSNFLKLLHAEQLLDSSARSPSIVYDDAGRTEPGEGAGLGTEPGAVSGPGVGLGTSVTAAPQQFVTANAVPVLGDLGALRRTRAGSVLVPFLWNAFDGVEAENSTRTRLADALSPNTLPGHRQRLAAVLKRVLDYAAGAERGGKALASSFQFHPLLRGEEGAVAGGGGDTDASAATAFLPHPDSDSADVGIDLSQMLTAGMASGDAQVMLLAAKALLCLAQGKLGLASRGRAASPVSSQAWVLLLAFQSQSPMVLSLPLVSQPLLLFPTHTRTRTTRTHAYTPPCQRRRGLWLAVPPAIRRLPRRHQPSPSAFVELRPPGAPPQQLEGHRNGHAGEGAAGKSKHGARISVHGVGHFRCQREVAVRDSPTQRCRRRVIGIRINVGKR